MTTSIMSKAKKMMDGQTELQMLCIFSIKTYFQVRPIAKN